MDHSVLKCMANFKDYQKPKAHLDKESMNLPLVGLPCKVCLLGKYPKAFWMQFP